MSSVFSKIIAGEIPSYKIYENEHAFVILDIHPLREGHCLVLSKKEGEQFFDLSSDELGGVMDAARIVAKKLNEVYEPKRILQMSHSYGVPHTHIHLIPTDSYEQVKQAIIDHETSDTDAPVDHEALKQVHEKLNLEQ